MSSEGKMDHRGVKGLVAGLGCGLIGWGLDTEKYVLLGFGIVLFFASYLIDAPKRT